MADAIQNSSSLPLPQHQTQDSTRDPLPVNSQERTEIADHAVIEQNFQTRQDDFKAYLNRSEILTLERNMRSLEFNTATDIVQNGVYHHPSEHNQP